MRFFLPLFYFIFLNSTYSHAENEKKIDAFDLPQVVAVEGRMYDPKSDVTASVGLLPLDAFYKALTLGLSYNRNMGDSITWGIINAQAAFTSETSLKKDLLALQVQTQGLLDYIRYYVTTDLIYTPIYGKNLLFNKSLLRTEMSLLASAGVVSFNSGDMVPMAGMGGQIRFFSSESISYKFDTRVYYHIAANKSSNFVLNIGLGISFDNPGDRQDDKKF
ncbi:MAG: outer membrane beta-barrel domain-containing protein [Pseudobdellovibrio sp.]